MVDFLSDLFILNQLDFNTKIMVIFSVFGNLLFNFFQKIRGEN